MGQNVLRKAVAIKGLVTDDNDDDGNVDDDDDNDDHDDECFLTDFAEILKSIVVSQFFKG
jgi:hypothetical protein